MLIRRAGQAEWREPEVSRYESEADLQRLLQSAPELLPGFVGRRLIVAREVQMRYGRADLVVVDEEGSIAIVECKLEENPEIKREIVGQLLEYASGTWRSTYDDFADRLTRRLGRRLEVAVEEASSVAGDPDWDVDLFRRAIERNLAEGRFHLVFAVDSITAELRDVVEYLNTQGGDAVSVLALELRYVRDEDVELLVPIVYGTESVRRKTIKRSRWAAAQLFEVLAEERSIEVADFFRDLVAWSEEHEASVITGSGKHPTLNAWFRFGDERVRVWYLGSNGRLSILWGRIRKSWGATAAERLFDRLQAISRAADELAGWDVKGDTSLPTDVLLLPGAGEVLKSGLADLVEPQAPSRT